MMRILPELFKLFTLKKDQDHEYRMTELQLKIDAARASQEIDKVHAYQGLEAVKGEMEAYAEAIKGQSVMSGVKWIDALSQSVRPFLTYWWMILFSVYKVYVLWFAETEKAFIDRLWTSEDAGILSMILGFWFVDRAWKYIKR